MPPTSVPGARYRCVADSWPSVDKTEYVGKNGGGRAGFSQQQASAMEAANRVFRGHVVGGAPCRSGLDVLDAAQRKPRSVEVFERERRLAEALDRWKVGDALLDKALGPVANRAFRDAEHSLLHFADSKPARRRAVPREEGEDRAGMASRIAVVQVIGGGVVEVHRLLYQAQAERSRVEIEVPARRACNARHVMDAAGHVAPPFWRSREFNPVTEFGWVFRAVRRLYPSPRGRQRRMTGVRRSASLTSRVIPAPWLLEARACCWLLPHVATSRPMR